MTQRICLVILVASVLGASPVAAQAKRAPRPGEVESDPIRCWWKADRSAIRVGEQFTLVLTCGVIETANIKVVPAVNQLEPGAISLTPFEAVAGNRHEDVVVPPWRYIQYEYAMRLLSEGFFGQDVNIPALTVTYNLQSPGALGSTEGRDQTYLLPPLPMRVLSIVPRSASDIRDASGQTFANVESRRNRATAEIVVASIAFAFAGVLATLALVRLAGRFRVRDSRAVRPLPAATVLRGAMAALGSARRDAAREGWTPALMSRALAALRIAGAVALGRRVAQRPVTNGTAERAGQIAVRSGLRRKRVLLSAATTPAAILKAIENGQGAASRETLQPILEALQLFSTAVYGRAGEADTVVLSHAVDNTVNPVRRLWLRSLIPFGTARGAEAASMPTRAGSAA